MKRLRWPHLRPQAVVAVPVYRLPLGNRVLTRALVDGETGVVLGRESDRRATLAWLDFLEATGTGGE